MTQLTIPKGILSFLKEKYDDESDNTKFISRFQIKTYIYNRYPNKYKNIITLFKYINIYLKIMVVKKQILQKKDSFRYNPIKKQSIKKENTSNLSKFNKTQEILNELECIKKQIQNLQTLVSNNQPTISQNIIHEQSHTDPNKSYTINISNKSCTCPDFTYRKKICKHLKKYI